MQTLVIVVRHKSDLQTYANQWDETGTKVLAITTPRAIADLCATEMAAKRRVLVHRCAFGAEPPCIIGSVVVKGIDPIDKQDCLVRFGDHSLVREQAGAPGPGQNFYFSES
jgi:hypothetical protein